MTVLKMTRRLAGLLGAILLLAAAMAVAPISAAPGSATPALAVLRGGCTGPFYAQTVCVYADMGSKNYSNKTEWVGTVRVRWVPGCPPVYGPAEVWGDGFYQSTHVGCSASWAINRWVRSGTNICGAYTESPGWRHIACISIRV